MSQEAKILKQTDQYQHRKKCIQRNLIYQTTNYLICTGQYNAFAEKRQNQQRSWPLSSGCTEQSMKPLRRTSNFLFLQKAIFSNSKHGIYYAFLDEKFFILWFFFHLLVIADIRLHSKIAG